MSAGAIAFCSVIAALVALVVVCIIRETKRQHAREVAGWNCGICGDCGTIWEYAGATSDSVPCYICTCGRDHRIWISASVAKNPRKVPRLFVLHRSLTKYSKANDITPKEYEYFKSILDSLPDYPNVMEHLELMLAPSRYSMNRLSMRLSWESPKLTPATQLQFPTITYELDGTVGLYVEGKLNIEPRIYDHRKAFDEFSMAVCG